MKRILKLLEVGIIILLALGVNSLVYATGRFVDIPIPPENKGKADFSSEEGEKQAQKYEKEQEKNQTTAEDFIGKSSNNNLKKVEIEGYQLEPAFNSQVSDYELIVDKKQEEKINVIAEAEDPKAKVEVNEGNIININVIAENGNLKVYTIKIVDTTEKEKNSIIETSASLEQANSKDKRYNITIGIIIIIMLALVIKKFAQSNKKEKFNK